MKILKIKRWRQSKIFQTFSLALVHQFFTVLRDDIYPRTKPGATLIIVTLLIITIITKEK